MLIDVHYIDIAKVNDLTTQSAFDSFPKNIQEEVSNFRFLKDRKLKIFGKMLLKHYVSQFGEDIDWKNWSINEYGKPFLNGANFHFNISHSENIVAVGFSKYPLGIDIEQKKHIDTGIYLSYFHKEEQYFLKKEGYSLNSFYYLWTRKEAFLKAKGIGLIDGLDKINCLLSEVVESNEGKWEIQTIEEIENYAFSVCYKKSNNLKTPSVIIKELAFLKPSKMDLEKK